MHRFFPLIIFVLPSMCTSARCQIALLDSVINQADAKSLVEYLASDSLNGRFPGTEGAKKAAAFIADEFRSAGTKAIAGYSGYLMPFLIKRISDKNLIGYNVLSALAGKTKADEIIVFSAHYDHVGTFSTNPFKNNGPLNRKDSIYNGANDDASGVAAVILLARYFAALNNNERTIIFIAFSGEELGLLGSQAASGDVQPDQIKAVINIEMIGRNPDNKVHPYITGADLSNLKSLLNNDLARYDEKKYGKQFFANDPYKEDRLFRRSDNWWFANLGIPAHTFMLTSPHDHFYHSPDDEVETLDFNIMTQVIQAIALGSENLVTGASTPERIKKSKIY